MVERHEVLQLLIVDVVRALKGIRRRVPLRRCIAKLSERGGKFKHRVPRLLQVVLPADDPRLDG